MRWDEELTVGITGQRASFVENNKRKGKIAFPGLLRPQTLAYSRGMDWTPELARDVVMEDGLSIPAIHKSSLLMQRRRRVRGGEGSVQYPHRTTQRSPTKHTAVLSESRRLHIIPVPPPYSPLPPPPPPTHHARQLSLPLLSRTTTLLLPLRPLLQNRAPRRIHPVLPKPLPFLLRPPLLEWIFPYKHGNSSPIRCTTPSGNGP